MSVNVICVSFFRLNNKKINRGVSQKTLQLKDFNVAKMENDESNMSHNKINLRNVKISD